jgi:hypothetical protein
MPAALLRKPWGIKGDLPVSKLKYMKIKFRYLFDWFFFSYFSWRFRWR